MTVEHLKAQASRLAAHLLAKHGFRLKRSASLEALAALNGVADWNTLSAQAAEGGAALTHPRGVPPSTAAEQAGQPLHPGLVEHLGSAAEPWLSALLDPAHEGQLFVVAGPCGCGKTTSLRLTLEQLEASAPHARIAVVNDAGEYFPRNVVTLEDAIRLRPDYVVLDELRGSDEQLAAVARLCAAGVKVLATLHAVDIRTAVRRLERLYEYAELAEQLPPLAAVLAQRLMRDETGPVLAVGIAVGDDLQEAPSDDSLFGARVAESCSAAQFS